MILKRIKNFGYSWLLLSILSLVLLLSGMSKLITLTGTVEEIYKWLLFTPVGFVDRLYLRSIIQLFSILEISLGFALFSSGKVKLYLLYTLLLFLFLMIVINGIQWASGFESCGCFGQVLKIPPSITIAKNVILVLIVLTLIKDLR